MGDTVEIILTDGDGAEHDIVVPELHAWSDLVSGKGKSTTLSFTATSPGTFAYYCDIPGHREAGMEGKLMVSESSAAEEAGPGAAPHGARERHVRRGGEGAGTPRHRACRRHRPGPHRPAITAAPAGPCARQHRPRGARGGGHSFPGSDVHLLDLQRNGPGPFFRVRVGDTVDVHFTNDASSRMSHSVDFHAVTGSGAGPS